MSLPSSTVPDFTDPSLVSNYVETAPRKVPGFADLHLMALLLISERAAESARILVLGAGGGLELRAFAEARPRWSFVGVDPSQQMLDLATATLGPLTDRITLLAGHIDLAPRGLFDGATCLLTLHFLTRSERLHTLMALRARLKPGAPLVIAHHTCPDEGKARLWMTRSAAFAAGPHADVEKAGASGK